MFLIFLGKILDFLEFFPKFLFWAFPKGLGLRIFFSDIESACAFSCRYSGGFGICRERTPTLTLLQAVFSIISFALS